MASTFRFMNDSPELTSMNVSLPVSQKEYVRTRAASTGCSTPSEYIRRLIHADQQLRAEEELGRKLLAGLASPGRDMTAKEWSKLRQGMLSELAKRRRAQ